MCVCVWGGGGGEERGRGGDNSLKRTSDSIDNAGSTSAILLLLWVPLRNTIAMLLSETLTLEN